MEETNYAILNLSASDGGPTFPKVSVNKSGGWVNFGNKNLFPQEIIGYNSESPVNAAIIESKVTYICGKGVRDSQANAEKYIGAPNTSESWDDLIEKIAKDYTSFGGLYLQIILSNDTKTVSIFHQDFSQVRIGEITETGKPVTFRISKDWTKTSGKNKPLELPVWPGIDRAKKGVAYMFYHWDYTPGLDYYCVPHYYSALNYIKADGKLGSFYDNSIDNGFTGSVVITMPTNPAEEKKAEFQRKFEYAFTGARGGSRVLMLWGESENVRPVVTPFSASANADIYNNVEGIVFQKIISAHRLSSPTLAGVAGSGNLSGNAAEIIDAYILYNYTVIEKLRRRILDSLNIFTKINGTGNLVIDELDVLPKIRETDNTAEEETAETPATLSKSKYAAAISAIKKLFGYERNNID